MYVPGYFPSTMTPFRGLKVYRNNAVGMFIHRCHNLRIEYGLFADNNMGIDLDRAEGIEVTNTEVIGMSPSYKALMERQPGVAPICDRNERVGIDLHTWQKEIDFIGAKISNVVMSGFADDPNCAKPSSLRFDEFVRCFLPFGSYPCYFVILRDSQYFHIHVIDFEARFIRILYRF